MRYLLFLLIALLVSCASQKKIAEYEAQPDWIQKKPVEAGYYIGIGSVKKVGTPLQYTREAKEDALADLASEIAIQVSSSSVLRTIETEYGNTQLFNQRIETRSSDYLEGFEPVEEYETEEKYWVYYRIGKKDYMEAKARKKEAAVSSALARYKAGVTAENKENYVEAMQFYLKGLQDLRAYLQEETPVGYEGKTIDAGNELYSAVSNLIAGLNIEPEQAIHTVKRGKGLNDKIVFVTTFQGKPVKNIPLSLTYSGGYLKDNRMVTDRNGFVSLDAGVIRSKNNKEIISATIDLSTIARGAVDDLFIRGLVTDKNNASAKVTIVIEPIRIFLIVEGPCESFSCEQLTAAFEEVVKSEGFVLGNPGTFDYTYNINFRLDPGTRAGGLTSINLTGQAEILDSVGKSTWTKKIDAFQGVGKTENEAQLKAFEAFRQSLRRLWFRAGLDAIR